MAFRNLRATGQRWLGTPYNGILASQILAETETGDHGPGALYNEAQQAEYVGKRLRMRVSNYPTVGTLRVEENGSYTGTGLSSGSNVFSYTLYVDGVLQAGSATLTINVGGVATVSAVTADTVFSGVAAVGGRTAIAAVTAAVVFSGGAVAPPGVTAQISTGLANAVFSGVAQGSKTLPGQTLSEDDITRICNEIWAHPSALTLQKFLGLK